MLFGYFDGTLRLEQRVAADIHLHGCQECIGYLWRYCEVVSLLAEQGLRKEPHVL